jgi:hypothetical protein
MKVDSDKIDIKENTLRRTGNLLDILLYDHSTKKNVIWGTDSYERYGKEFSINYSLKPELVTGLYGKLIQPRASKSMAEQRRRTKEKAEVFTPLQIVEKMNDAVDRSTGRMLINKKNWQNYVKEIRLEITCGEAPFIVSRYDPTSNERILVKLKNRVGFLELWL